MTLLYIVPVLITENRNKVILRSKKTDFVYVAEQEKHVDLHAAYQKIYNYASTHCDD